jgi:hypothetical protein
MQTNARTVEDLVTGEYKYGFVTPIEADAVPRGLNEETVRTISAKKKEPQFMLEWRLKAYRYWAGLEKSQAEPKWANVKYPPIDYQNIIYYSAPKTNIERPKSLDDIDPELRATYEKLGIPLKEQELLTGVAVDAVFDSVSVATTFKEKLGELGIIFCSFSEAVQEHPELVRKYLGSVVPYTDNFFASLNSAVFSDGSFCYVPKGVRCPMELSTYFRINAMDTGQFERTLIIADRSRQRSDQVFDRAELVSRRQRGQRRDLQLRHQARQVSREELENFLDAGRNRLGDHLEVSELYLAGRQFNGGILLGRADQQLPAGGHRHEDDPYREKHQEHDHLQGDLGRPRAKLLQGIGQDHERRRRGEKLFPVRLSAARRQVRGAHFSLS